jgi:Pvc16 N-terminal domain
MIQEGLIYVVNDMNAYFQKVMSPPPIRPMVILSVIAGQSGSIAIQEENVLILSVQSIWEEKRSGSTNGRGDRRSPIDLYIFVLFAAYFPPNLTAEGLGFLGMVIRYFDEQPSFSRDYTPDLPVHIHKMAWEIYNLSFAEQSNLWSAIGAKQMPSIMYRMHLQMVPQPKIQATAPPVRERNSQQTPNE